MQRKISLGFRKKGSWFLSAFSAFSGAGALRVLRVLGGRGRGQGDSHLFRGRLFDPACVPAVSRLSEAPCGNVD